MSETAKWLMGSPRKLAGCAAIVLVGWVLLLSALPDGDSKARPAPAPTPTATAVVPDSSWAVDAALTFVSEWCALRPRETKEQWLDRLEPLTAPDLIKGLATTDVAQLPSVGPEGDPSITFLGPESAGVRVPLGDGSAVRVTVVLMGAFALVSNILPDQGD